MTTDLTPKQIAELLDMLEVINRIGDAVRARAIELAHSGTEIPGWEAARTPARRLWTDEAKAAERLRELGLTKKEEYVTTLVSPAQAEKLLRAKQKWPKRPRGSAGEDFEDPFKPVLGYTETNPTIKKVSI